MKKILFILAIVLVLTLMITLSASATKPDYVEGYVPFDSWFIEDGYEKYDVCDEHLVGQVVQPAAPPGFAIHGIFTSGDSDHCEIENSYVGTCNITLVPVEMPGNPESKPGRGVISQCSGDLKGLHGRYVINFDFTYDAWYHWEP